MDHGDVLEGTYVPLMQREGFLFLFVDASGGYQVARGFLLGSASRTAHARLMFAPPLPIEAGRRLRLIDSDCRYAVDQIARIAVNAVFCKLRNKDCLNIFVQYCIQHDNLQY